MTTATSDRGRRPLTDCAQGPELMSGTRAAEARLDGQRLSASADRADVTPRLSARRRAHCTGKDHVSDLSDWPDLAGRIIEDRDDRRHVLPVRVYFEDTDAGGIAYHASYIRWCERGRTDFLRLLGTDSRRLIDGSESHEPAAFVVRRMNCEFLRPSRMDDVLFVETRVKALGGASVTLMQTVVREGRPVFEAEVTVVLVAVSGKPLRLTSAIRSGFSPPTP